jgi:glutamine cyclotransferase
MISSTTAGRQFLIGCLLLAGCSHPVEQKKSDAPDILPVPIPYEVRNVFPHDTTSYTEGFLVEKGQLYESTGHTGSIPSSRSLFGPVDLGTGKITPRAEIEKSKYFGEGIAFVKNRIYQLTDTTQIGFIWDGKTFKKLGNFYYTGEGWGLTTNGSQLIMSNGSSNITYRDPQSLLIIKTLGVTDNNGPVQNINELELIHGSIYANQWLTDYILKIDTTTGKVVGRLDVSGLKKEAQIGYVNAAETNGIAYDSSSDKIYITGKLWPHIYEINFPH